jgi:fatty-acyl-CoA synthase
MTEVASIRNLLRDAWTRFGERPALVTDNGSTGFAELGERSFRLANVLAELGVTSRDTVGVVFSLDYNQMQEIAFAAGELGATRFGIPPAMLDGDGELLRTVGPKVVLYDQTVFPGVSGWLSEVLPGVRALATGGAKRDYEGLLAGAPATSVESTIEPDALAGLGFTSGTTGRPKGIGATHRASEWSCGKMRETMATIDDPGRGGILIGIPLFAAGSGMVVPALSVGMTVYAPSRFDPEETLRLIDNGDVVSAFLTPSMVIDLLDSPGLDDCDLSRLESIVYGTSIMPLPRIEEAVRRIGPVMLQGYGMAEVLPPVSILHRHEHGTREQPADAETLSSCGRPVEGVRVRVVAEDGRELPANEIGEVEVQSPGISVGYLYDQELDRANRRDGWWRSGDIGFFDGRQRLHVLARAADVMRRDGAAVYPRLIEEALGYHEAVKEACAVQVEPEGGILVAVSLRRAHRRRLADPTLVGELEEHMAGRLEQRLRPQEIRIFEEVPRSVQGKVLHREVREAVAREQRPEGT